MLKVQIKHNSWRKIELKAEAGAEWQQKQQRVAAPGHPAPKKTPKTPRIPALEPKTQLNPRHFHDKQGKTVKGKPERKNRSTLSGDGSAMLAITSGHQLVKKEPQRE